MCPGHVSKGGIVEWSKEGGWIKSFQNIRSYQVKTNTHVWYSGLYITFELLIHWFVDCDFHFKTYFLPGSLGSRGEWEGQVGVDLRKLVRRHDRGQGDEGSVLCQEQCWRSYMGKQRLRGELFGKRRECPLLGYHVRTSRQGCLLCPSNKSG